MSGCHGIARSHTRRIGSEELLMAKRFDVKTAFEQGVREYFNKCGHLQAHEKPHQ
jgi:hypothetical protein